MDVSDLLLAGIEASIAIAGFSGIIAGFQFNDAKKIHRADAVGLTIIVQVSLLMAFCCALPLLLSAFEIQDTTLWSICSILGAMFGAYYVYTSQKEMRKGAGITRRSVWLINSIMTGLVLLSCIGNLLNISNVLFHREPGPFIFGIVIGLCLAGYLFSRFLLAPVWRTVRQQEARPINDEEVSVA